jgi:hypothetical protein
VGNSAGGPVTRRLILLGVAVAIPLAAVALYFAVLVPSGPVAGPGAPPTAGPAGAAAKGLPADHPPIGGAGTGPAADRTHPQVGGTGRAVRVPDAIRGKWQAVRLQIEIKGAGRAAQPLVANLGNEVAVPGSDLTLRADEFLPALQVKDNEITSLSNEPSNPAALVTITEKGKQVFHGWLFSKFPEMQPFDHPTYRITLIDGVPKR